ncbi:hypothetical protein [Tropicimonas sediminicola]|uniref:Uncharacterized protein n=1 Tax=Tropicimonas sediminicola TaxID=1031541 RepID=A0A239DA69_9RHOB|nr:hypothetical protein [Tropicimonas sediminicola]SNS29200.1 hypothetical protein SAMN05421757_101722 [Tropicimonas sediminicola]
MVASFVLSLLAGFLTSRAEPLLVAVIRRLGGGDVVLAGVDLRVLGFGLMLLIAATLVALLGADSSAWLAVSGGLLGYFGRDLYAFARDPHGAAGAAEDNWDGELAQPGERRTPVDAASGGPDAVDARDDEAAAEITLRAVKEAMEAEPSQEGDEHKETDR